MIRISVHIFLKNTENIRHRSLTALEPNVSCLVFCLIFFVLRYMYLWRSELPFCNWSRVAKNLPVWYMLPFICRSNPSEKIRIIPYPQISCYTVHINYLQNDVLLNYFCLPNLFFHSLKHCEIVYSANLFKNTCIYVAIIGKIDNANICGIFSFK